MHLVSLDQPFQWVQVEFKVSCNSKVTRDQWWDQWWISIRHSHGHIWLILAGDTDKIVPKNTYGMTKACGELFINDYTRKEGKWGLVLSEAS